ncbi:unnamed protein product [Nesidiocoris tenuis]|uniref:Uncharacterized protein n=1 Tax=Nesidiocoris tenuis TaxID=355587 RepID=A0A6H5HMM3_9HEMI|nr:unnamed protein product [Nesidiocoris tenuis]
MVEEEKVSREDVLHKRISDLTHKGRTREGEQVRDESFGPGLAGRKSEAWEGNTWSGMKEVLIPQFSDYSPAPVASHSSPSSVLLITNDDEQQFSIKMQETLLQGSCSGSIIRKRCSPGAGNVQALAGGSYLLETRLLLLAALDGRQLPKGKFLTLAQFNLRPHGSAQNLQCEATKSVKDDSKESSRIKRNESLPEQVSVCPCVRVSVCPCVRVSQLVRLLFRMQTSGAGILDPFHGDHDKRSGVIGRGGVSVEPNWIPTTTYPLSQTTNGLLTATSTIISGCMTVFCTSVVILKLSYRQLLISELTSEKSFPTCLILAKNVLTGEKGVRRKNLHEDEIVTFEVPPLEAMAYCPITEVVPGVPSRPDRGGFNNSGRVVLVCQLLFAAHYLTPGTLEGLLKPIT